MVLGQDLGFGVYELIAIEGNWSNLVGDVAILDRYDNNEVDLILPTIDYTHDDGVSYVGIPQWDLGSASAMISGSNGFQAVVAAGLVDITTTVIEQTESGGDPFFETVTYTTFAPLWNLGDASLASQVAFEMSNPGLSSPIVVDISDQSGTGGGGGSPGGGGSGGGTTGGSGSAGAGELCCEKKCAHVFRIAEAACIHQYDVALSNCLSDALGVGGVSCIGLGGLCTAIGTPAAGVVCCILGGVGGATWAYWNCQENADDNLELCRGAAFDTYALCMLNQCGIVIATN